MKLPTLALCAVALLAACGPTMPSYDYAAEPNPLQQEWVIGVADQLQITVWENPGLTTSVKVRPDGTITMPLVGDLTAVGRTPSQLRAEIETKLAAFIKDNSAVVTVAVTEANSYQFTVSGEVVRGGVFNSDRYVTVVDALSMAGGFTRFAKKDRITIVRRGTDGSVRQIPISYDAIAGGGHEEMNLVLLSGDTVIVP